MPPECAGYSQTWADRHPEWEMRLWTDDALPKLTNQELYDKMSIPSQKADIASFEILYQYGGVYIDTDFECYRNIEPLLHGVEAFAGCEETGIISHGIMGAVAGHPAFKALVDGLATWVSDHSHMPPNVQTGPIYITATLGSRPDFHRFAPTLFYPYSWRERHKKGQHFPDAYAAHHWAASWLPLQHRR